MPGFLNNITTINQSDITNLANVSGLPEFFVKINNIVFDGVLWFIILWIIWVILFVVFQEREDQILNNIMYSGGLVTILSFFIRGVNVVINGVSEGLIDDHKMWVFAIITLVVVIINWGTKRD